MRPRSPPRPGIEESPSNPRNNMSHRHFCPICMLYHQTALETRCCANTICESCASSVALRATGHAALVHVIEATTPIKGGDAARPPGTPPAPINTTTPRQHQAPPITTTTTTTAASSRGHHFIRQVMSLRSDGGGGAGNITVVPCPYCQRSLKLRILTDKVSSKSYEDSPMVQKHCAVRSMDDDVVLDSSHDHHHQHDSDVSIASSRGNFSSRGISVERKGEGSEEGGVYGHTMQAFRRGGVLHSFGGKDAPSPVKTGDSYEALRRKLVPLPRWGGAECPPSSSSSMAPAPATTSSASQQPSRSAAQNALPQIATTTSLAAAGGLPPRHSGRRLPNLSTGAAEGAAQEESEARRGRSIVGSSRVSGNNAERRLQPAAANRGQSLPAVHRATANKEASSSWCPIM